MITYLAREQSDQPVKYPELFIYSLFTLPILHFVLLAILPEHASTIHLLRPIGVIGSVFILFYAAFITQHTRRWSWFCHAVTMLFASAYNLLRIWGIPLTHQNMQLLALAIYIGSLIGSGLYLQQRSWWVGNRWRVISSGITVGYASLVIILVYLPSLLPAPNGRITTTLAYIAYDVGILFSFGLQTLRQGIFRSPARFLVPGLLCLLLADIVGVVFALHGTTVNWHWPLYTFHAIFLGLTAYHDAIAGRTQDSASITPLKEWIVWSYLPLCLVLVALFATSTTTTEGVSSLLLTGLIVVAICNEAIAVHDYQRITVALHRAQLEAADVATFRERTRLARDFHDSLGAHLSGLTTNLRVAKAVLQDDPKSAAEAIIESQQIVREAVADVRITVDVLRNGPITRQPLFDLINRLIERNRAGGIATDLTILGTPYELSTSLNEALYRVVQEGLTNIRKHAQATQATVQIDYRDPRCVHLLIEDNGQGVDQAKGGFGLIGIRERVEQIGGTFHITTAPSQGLRLEVEVPTA